MDYREHHQTLLPIQEINFKANNPNTTHLTRPGIWTQTNDQAQCALLALLLNHWYALSDIHYC